MSNIPEKNFGQYELSLRDINGAIISASVDCGCRDWTVDKKRNVECRINLKWDDQEIECTTGDFFSCLKQVRKQLAVLGIYPVCYGASRQTIVTGMAVDMGLGMRAYKNTELGCWPNRFQVVNIFSTGDDVEPVSVDEQEKYKLEWIQSMRKND